MCASFLGIFAIPPLYVTFQWIAEKLKRGPSKAPEPQEKLKDAHSSERLSARSSGVRIPLAGAASQPSKVRAIFADWRAHSFIAHLPRTSALQVLG